MKRQVSYSRKIQSHPYENISVNYTMEFDDEDRDPDNAFRECRRRVLGWMKEEINRLGVTRYGEI